MVHCDGSILHDLFCKHVVLAPAGLGSWWLMLCILGGGYLFIWPCELHLFLLSHGNILFTVGSKVVPVIPRALQQRVGVSSDEGIV